MDVQDFSNIQCFTGKRWKNSGIAVVSVMGNVCTILKVKMKDHISTEFSDIYYFYESLIFHLFNFTEKIVWKNADPTFQKDFLEVIAYFDKKVVGKERIRTVYKADVINKSDDMLYYVEKHKQENEEIAHNKALIAKFIAFVPLCLVILFKLILPFVLMGIKQLSKMKNSMTKI